MKLTKKLAAMFLALCLSFSVSAVGFAKTDTKAATDATTAASSDATTGASESAEDETAKAVKALDEQIKVMEKVFDAKAFKALKDKDVTAYSTTMGVATKNVKIADLKTKLTKACETKLKELVTVTKIKAGKKTNVELLKEVKKTKTTALVDLIAKAAKK